jgi:D-aspartate ligase
MTSPAFVLGLGVNGLGIVRALGRRGIPVVGFFHGDQEVGRHSRYCRAERVLDPRSDRSAYLDRMEALASESSGPPVLFPTNDATVALVVEERERLGSRFRFVLPKSEAVFALMDKSCVVEIARRAGIPTPVTVTVSTLDEALRQAARMPFPCLAKPRSPWTGAAQRLPKVTGLASRAAFEEFVRSHEASLPLLAFQEVIPGEDHDYGFCCLYRDTSGAILAHLTGQTIHRYPPGLGWIATCVVTSIPELRAASEQILAQAGYVGLAEVEFKRDPRDGRYKLFEVNTRSWAHNILAASCGVDFMHIAYRDSLGLPPAPLPRPRERAYMNSALEAGVWWRMMRAGRFPEIPWRVLAWGTVHPYFAWDDPLPAVHKVAERFA